MVKYYTMVINSQHCRKKKYELTIGKLCEEEED